MRRLSFLFLAFPLSALACGGSNAGDVFNEVPAADTGSAGADTSTPPNDTGSGGGEDVVDPPPPRDSGAPAEDTSDPPPPVDTGIVPDTALPPVDAGGPCPEGWKTFGGHCYLATTGSRSWVAQRDACAGAGAHLVTINSAEEMVFVQSLGSGERWIGMYRPESSPYAATSYRWVTPETSTYRNWGMSEPNFSGQCVRMLADGKWADQRCDWNFIAICERE